MHTEDAYIIVNDSDYFEYIPRFGVEPAGLRFLSYGRWRTFSSRRIKR